MPEKISKTAKILQMIAEGTSANDIAKRLKTSRNYVYYVKWNAAKKNNKAEAKSKVKRQLDTHARARETVQAIFNGATALPSVPSSGGSQNNPLDTQVGGDHYKTMKIQPVEFIVANNLGFLEGCIVKRVSRWRAKGGLQDLYKIKHEVDLLIADEQRKESVRN